LRLQPVTAGVGTVIPRDELALVFGDDRVVEVETLDAVAARGVWRVRRGDRTAVLKVASSLGSGHPRWPAAADPDDPYYWNREPLAYRSGLLDGVAPRCLAVVERDEATVALWLEDVEPPAGAWTPERFAEVAERLGRLQAAPAPSAGWLARGWLPAYLRLRRDLVGAGGSAAQELGSDAEEILARLDRAPQCLTHHDFHPANLLGGDASVVIDWPYCGVAARGLDAGVLVADALLDGVVAPELSPRVEHAVWDGYLRGLRAGGFDGGEAEIAHTFFAGTALRYAWIPGRLAGDLDRETGTRWTATLPLLLDWARRGRQLRSDT
jgi:Phosphotransferase enzyme family